MSATECRRASDSNSGRSRRALSDCGWRDRPAERRRDCGDPAALKPHSRARAAGRHYYTDLARPASGPNCLIRGKTQRRRLFPPTVLAPQGFDGCGAAILANTRQNPASRVPPPHGQRRRDAVLNVIDTVERMWTSLHLDDIYITVPMRLDHSTEEVSSSPRRSTPAKHEVPLGILRKTRASACSTAVHLYQRRLRRARVVKSLLVYLSGLYPSVSVCKKAIMSDSSCAVIAGASPACRSNGGSTTSILA